MPSRGAKPAKPSPDYPLFAHASGTWAKKIDGKHRHFGAWDDPDGALLRFEREYGKRFGRRVRSAAEYVTIGEVVNRFLTARHARIAEGELQLITLEGYRAACKRFCAAVGKERSVASLTPDDFRGFRERISRNRGSAGIAGDIRAVRMAFKFAVDERIVDALPHYGQAMKLPSKKRLRQERRERGPKLFSRDELRGLIAVAKAPVKAMVLLGINCGLGNSDFARLQLDHVDLDAAWLNYPRPKTWTDRECWLWPETVEALREVLLIRPKPKPIHDNLFFITRRTRQPWVRFKVVAGPNPRFQVEDAIVFEFRKLLTLVGISRPRCGIYWLRHCTETIGGEARDQIALNYIMGHVDGSMSAQYRETVSRERITAVSAFVRKWLFASS